MLIARTIRKSRKIISDAKKKNKTIGFVPTMGALHEGHLSLVRSARKDCNFVVVSIFVNPTQFGPKEDFRKYPRVFNKDKILLEKEKVDLVFYPGIYEMYAKDSSTHVEENCLSSVLCGMRRPGHFRGVCTVVAKLFNIIEPDIAYFGQKDYQQAQVIKRMARDLNFDVNIKTLPIVREKNGLAMSSRNAYLTKTKKQDALVLADSLRLAKKLTNSGEKDTRKIIKAMQKNILSKKNTKIDYIEIVDALTLKPLKKISEKALIALAVYVGRTRLIDNIIISVRL